MAGDVAVADLSEHGALGAAALAGERTAGVEGAARRRIERGGQLALQHHAFALFLDAGRARVQRARIGMEGLPEDRIFWALLHPPAHPLHLPPLTTRGPH